MIEGNDVIAAISTPPGESGIGIIRISGPGCAALADPILKLSSYKRLRDCPSGKLCHGFVVSGKDKKVDEILVSYIKGPKTYTAEDTVEINCHGGPIPLRKTLELAVKAGARLSEPGEFTKRAFLNGRIDLTQAEAVAEIITAKSKQALDVAINQIQGKLSEEITQTRDSLVEVLANIEAAVDFSEEEPEIIKKWTLLKQTAKARKRLNKLLDTFESGRMLKEGILTVIAGPPNAGKSSLLNALLKHERAIVTEIPGTTRDLIEETVNIKGAPLIIRDTAGLRKPKDIAEKAGVNLTEKSIGQADLVLLVIDGSKKDKKSFVKLAKLASGKKTITVINKKDLGLKIKSKDIDAMVKCADCIEISAKFDQGIDHLEKAINKAVFTKGINSREAIITNVRHKQLLQKTVDLISEAEEAMLDQPEEITALFLRESLKQLDMLTGKDYREDFLDKIFSKFCIGK